MKVLLDEHLSRELADGMRSIIGLSCQDKIAHVDAIYLDKRSKEQWKQVAPVDGWAIFSGDYQFQEAPQKVAAWRSLNIPVVFLSQSMMRVPIVQKAGLILVQWPHLRSAFLTNGLHIFDGRSVKLYEDPPPRKPRLSSPERQHSSLHRENGSRDSLNPRLPFV